MIFIKNKTKILFLVLIIISLTIIFNINKEAHHNSIAVYLDNIESTSIPDKNSNYVIDKIVCENDATGTWDNINWSLLVTNLSKRSNCKLHFKSKKDITITYDNNYIKNDIFDDVYNTSQLINNGVSSETTYNIEKSKNTTYYKFISGTNETANGGSGGFYHPLKSTRLDSSKQFTIAFEAKGNTEFNAFIGSEQMPVLNNYAAMKITENYQKYVYTFTPRENSRTAFIFYGWLAKDEERILEVRNISLQEGEYTNFTTISLKEYDTLNNTLPTPTRDNYTFLGWYTDPIEGEKVSSETIATENNTYYAHWQYNE